MVAYFSAVEAIDREKDDRKAKLMPVVTKNNTPTVV